jgi:D-glycero-D-manno-heptose 1,7-bisphosphate phosphatase
LRKLVFLDRDGVINEDSADYIKSPDEWVPIAGSLEAIARLSRAGYEIIVVTNQSGLARGLFDEETLAAIHARLRRAVEAVGGRIAGIFHCPHLPESGCDCRKPRPGLIERAESVLGVRAGGAPLVGDKESDLVAARRAGCRPILVRTGHGGQWQPQESELGRVEVCRDLAQAVERILEWDAPPPARAPGPDAAGGGPALRGVGADSE